MIKKLWFSTLIAFFLISIFLQTRINVFSAGAATLTFDPATKDANVNDSIDINTIVNAGAENILSVDGYIKYDETMLEFQKFTDGDFFPIVTTEEISDGNLYIGAYVDDPATTKTGTGTYATITFKALKEGTTTVEYFCDDTVNESSEVIKDDIDATNIINCSANGTSVITIASSGTSVDPTSTPTPTSTPVEDEDTSTGGTGGSETVADSTDEVTELPQSGILDNILRVSIPGAALLLIGIALKLLL